jgi:hypothetical protein
LWADSQITGGKKTIRFQRIGENQDSRKLIRSFGPQCWNQEKDDRYYGKKNKSLPWFSIIIPLRIKTCKILLDVRVVCPGEKTAYNQK